MPAIRSFLSGRGPWAVWATAAAGVLLSIAAAAWQARSNADRLNDTLRDETERVADLISDRVKRLEYGLLSARGLALGIGWDKLSREAFVRYAASRNIDHEFPGARGVGVIRRVRPEQEAAFSTGAAADGWPDFAIRALAPHGDERFVIQYIEPVDRNRQAVGLDIGSEANRRRAANDALRTGQATLTGPITLVQASGKPRAGFLILLPVYPDPVTAVDTSNRAARALGWTYAPLVIDEVLAALGLDVQTYRLTIADVDGTTTTPFYDSSDTTSEVTEFRSTTERAVAGRIWRVDVQALPTFLAAQHFVAPSTVGLLGLLLTFLAAATLVAWNRARAHALALEAEREQRAVAMQISHDAIVMADADGLITDWNDGAQTLFGYHRAEVLGRGVVELLVPPEHHEQSSALRLRVKQGHGVPAFETQRLDRDGQLIDVSMAAVPLPRKEGRFTGVSISMRDIRPAKQAERAVQQLNASLELQVVQRTALLDTAQRTLRTMLDAMPSQIGYWDTDLRNRVANSAYGTWFGVDVQGLEGLHMREVIGEALYAQSLPKLQAALAGERQTFYEQAVDKADGSGKRHAQVIYLPDIVNGEVQGLFTMVHDVSELMEGRQRLAAALRDSQALLSTLQAHSLVSITDRTGRIVEVNDHFCAVSKYSREELVGQTHRVVNSRVQSPAFWAEMWKTISSGRSWRGDVCNRAKDGSLYWVDSIIAPFVGEDGRIEKYVSIRTDITQRNEFREQLLRTNERFAIAAAAAGLGFWDFDVARNATRWDDQMFRLFGHAGGSGEASPDALFDDALHADDKARVENQLAQALAGIRPFDAEFRIVRPDGGLRHLRAVARVTVDQHGLPLRMIGVNFDVTDQRGAETRLREVAVTLQAVLDASSEVAIIATDATGLIRVFNRGAERLLGLSADDVVNQLRHLAFHDPQEVRERRDSLARKLGRAVRVAEVFDDPEWLGRPREWTYQRTDGRRVPISLILTPIAAAGGQPTGYLGIAQDITDRKAAERSLLEATSRAEAANHAKSDFLANMSHEIRSPLNAVLGLTYLLRQSSLDTEQVSYVDRIKLASDTLLLTINDVLDLSKIEAGEMTVVREPFAPGNAVGDVVSVMSVPAQNKGLPVRLVLDPGMPPRVLGDGVRLTQVLNNLVSNAIKFTPQGHVEVRAAWRPDGDHHGLLSLTVQDTGIGMDADAMARIFEPFVQADGTTTRRFGGTGLGLSIVKRLVELMGGTVGVQSTPGQGSTFRVEIPFETAGEHDLPTTREQVLGADALAGRTILVVDDSDINRDVARRILQRKGANVLLAEDGGQAVQLLRQEGPRVDLVLMDVHMPVMDGFEATRRIRDELKLERLPVLALTAGATTRERDAALAAGMDEFVTKPFDPVRLLHTIVQRLSMATAPVAAPMKPPPATPKSAGDMPPDAAQNASTSCSTWPEIDGIDMPAVRERMGESLSLFGKLLHRQLDTTPRLVIDGDLTDATVRAQAIQTVHRLCGSAGTLGMDKVHALAAKMEAHLRDERLEPAQALQAPIDAELERLRQASAAFLAAQAARTETAVPPLAAKAVAATDTERAAIDELIGLLTRRSLRSGTAFEKIAPHLRTRLGEDAFRELREHMDHLRYAPAKAVLESIVAGVTGPASATPSQKREPTADSLDAPALDRQR